MRLKLDMSGHTLSRYGRCSSIRYFGSFDVEAGNVPNEVWFHGWYYHNKDLGWIGPFDGELDCERAEEKGLTG